MLAGIFGGGDSTTADRGTATTDAVTVSPTIAPIVNPTDQAAATVQAGVSQTATPQSGPIPAAAPSAGVTINVEPQSLLPISEVTASQASTGIAPIIEQAVQRSAIARSTWSQYEVEIHKKFSLAVACIVFVLLGAPIALRFPRGGVGLVIGASLAVFSLYYICLIAGESMADDGVLPPWLAMWAANGAFTIVGVVLYLRMGREGSTARGGDLDDVKDRIRAWFASLRPSARRPAPIPATDA